MVLRVVINLMNKLGNLFLDLFNNLLRMIIPTAKKVKKAVSKTLRFRLVSGPQLASLPEQYVRQVGILQAEIAKRDRMIKELKAELELMKGKKKQELIKLIEQRRKYLEELRKSETAIIVPSGIKGVKVLSREGKFLGWFYGFSIRKNLIGIVVTTKPSGKGKKYIVHEAPSIKDLIHNSETFGHQLNVSKVIILTRTYDGVWVPDFEVWMPVYPGVHVGKGKYRCPYCGEEFEFEQLVSHLRKVHGVTKFGKYSEDLLKEMAEKAIYRRKESKGGGIREERKTSRS